MPDVQSVLRRAEDRLRAEGLTGGRAFEVLLSALRARAGDADAIPRPDLLQDLPTGDLDLLGLAYERFFADLFKGRRGQFFTPRPLIRILLAGAKIGPGDRVLDPTCGSGGILLCAARLGADVRGVERDPLLAELARVNLRLAGLPGEVACADFFVDPSGSFDAIVANPPFSVAVEDPAILAGYRVAEGRRKVASEALFCEAIGRSVRPGGRAAFVAPWSLVADRSAAPAREILDAGWSKEAICALPEGVFRPFGGAAGRAALVWLRRGPQTAPTRWAELADPGWDVRSTRLKPTPGDADAMAVELEVRGFSGWAELPPGAWLPSAGRPPGSRIPVAKLARPILERRVPARTPEDRFWSLDLADVDPETGEAVVDRKARGSELRGARLAARPGDVLVSRLRPDRGNVTIVPADREPVVSPEWVVLRPARLGRFLHLALRTPAWRASLPEPGGQTHPRIPASAVADSEIPWPGEDLASRIDRLAGGLYAEREALRRRILALRKAVDGYAAGELDEAGLDAALRALEEP